ncbi:glycoside hydrolase family 6 protein [Streptomyces sp. enrichment culture]|uniref:glycoside hydrolase family 6 protein n=1 Tax=Streptomyces sp. enrichment culture TaxID=1795815 RepID=UPI003F559325
MVAAASAVVVAGAVSGVVSAAGEGRREAPEARPVTSASPRLVPLPAVLSTPPPATVSASPSVRPRRTSAPPSASPSAQKPGAKRKRTVPVSARLHRHPASRVLDWVRAHPGDPRRPVIESRTAEQSAAVWFADRSPDTVTARVRAVTSGGAAQGRVPVVVPYATPGRDCGGHSEGGAPDFAAYDDRIDRFAAGLGSGEAVVILEPDSVAQADCLSAGQRAERFASLARAGRVLKEANARTRVHHDAGHSGWHTPARQADLPRRAGAASPASSDRILSNVSNFHGTDDKIAYDRAVPDALGTAGLGAVIDTSRNGNGAPADGEWCDPAGRRLGRAPTPTTGEARIDAHLWVKPPGGSDGCKGASGTGCEWLAYRKSR